MGRKKKQQSSNSAVPLQVVNSVNANTTGNNSVKMGYWLMAAAIILPLLISSMTSDPVLPIRFIGLSIFCCCLTIYFLLIKKNLSLTIPRLPRLVFLAGLLFGAVACVSLAFSINPGAGYFDLAKHFLQLTFLLLCVLIFTKEPAAAAVVCKGLVIAAMLQSLVGVLQFYEVAFAGIQGANDKPFGLMANRNLFGSAQLLVLPFVLYILYAGSRFWKAAASASIFLLIFSLILSQTRSAWLGAIAVFFISLLLMLLYMKGNRKKWLLYYGAAAAITAGLGILIVLSDAGGDLSKSIRQRVGLQSTVNETNPASVSSNANERVKIWKKTILLIKDHPALGVGYGNWKINVRNYGSGGMTWENGKYVPDRPHNVALQVTAETGFAGVFFYLSMWLLTAWAGFLSLKKNGDKKSNWLCIVMLAGLGAFAVDSMFSFPTERVEHTIYITLMSALLLASYSRSKADESTQKPVKLNFVIMLPGVLIAAFCIYIGLKKYTFEQQLPLAVAYQKANRNEEAILAAEEGNNRWVTLNEEGKSLQIYSSLAYMSLKKYPEALEEGRLALQYNPNSAMVYNNIGAVYANMNKFDSASIYYEKAVKLSPGFEEVLKNLAGCYYNLKQYDKCIAALEKLDISKDSYLTKLMGDAKILKQAALNTGVPVK
jgi:O-antigen ligase